MSRRLRHHPYVSDEPRTRARTREDFAALLAAGGFVRARTAPSAIALRVFEGRRA